MPGIDLTVLYSRLPKSFARLKLRNAIRPDGFRYIQMRGLHFNLRFGEKDFPVVFNPSLPLRLMRLGPHVIICEGESNLANDILVVLYAKITKKPYLWWGLGTAVRGSRASVLRRVLNPVVGWMLRGCAGVLAYSTFAKEFYLSTYGVDERSIFVMHNSVDTEAVRRDIPKYSPQVMERMSEIGIAGKRVVLFVGSFEPAKRIDVLIEAYSALKRVDADLALLLVGDGEDRPRLEAQVRRDGVEDVVFAGERIDDVTLYFLMGDVFALPGLGGLAINQAMAHGLPVVAVEADGTELDMVVDGQNGFIADGDSPAALARAIGGVLEDETERRRMGEESRRLVETKFNIGGTAATIEEAVRYAVDRSGTE